MLNFCNEKIRNSMCIISNYFPSLRCRAVENEQEKRGHSPSTWFFSPSSRFRQRFVTVAPSAVTWTTAGLLRAGVGDPRRGVFISVKAVAPYYRLGEIFYSSKWFLSTPWVEEITGLNVMKINSVLREFIPDVLMITFFLALAFITSAESGCYQKRMCCHGRNITCTALDDGTSQLPLLNPHRQQKHRHRDDSVNAVHCVILRGLDTVFFPAIIENQRDRRISPIRRPSMKHPVMATISSIRTWVTLVCLFMTSVINAILVFDEVNQQRIGKIVFPDVVELEGSGAEDIYNKYAFIDESPDDKHANKVPKTIRRQKKKTPSSVAPQITHLLFGYPLTPAEPSEDILRYTSRPKRLWLRYSVLDKYLPLTVSTTPTSGFYDEGHL
uniref:Uncharacterized protein n=1 Tax=Angiostrongylus costaricensis TaxID=334426 RepID=A0A158PHA9_ANGCS